MLRAPSSGLSGASASAGVTRRPAHQEYVTRLLSIRPAARLAYWMLAEPSGATIVDSGGAGRNGVYTAVTLGQPGIGDGRTAASFDGVASVGNVYSAGLASAFNPLAGSIGLWMKVANAGVWSDATIRRGINLQADASNRVGIFRSATAGRLDITNISGGVTQTAAILGLSTTDWFHVGLTWNKTADQLKGYMNGVQVDLTKSGIGTWAGTLAATGCNLGASVSTPAQVWSGLLQHAIVWNAALTDAEMYAAGTR